MKLTLIILNTWHYLTQKDWYGMISRGGYAPSTLRILASLIPADLNIEVEILDENIEQINFDNIQADLIGISVLTANAPRAYQLADGFRLKGMRVVMGGYHVTFESEEALQHCDSVVIGFAEASWPQLLKDFTAGKLKQVYDADFEAAYRSHRPLTNLPPSYKKKYLLPYGIELTRGCNNNCVFCTIPLHCKGQQVKRPIPAILEELNFLNARKFVFLDSSPFEDKSYALELFKALKPLKLQWYSCMTTRDAGDEQFVKEAAECGCEGVLIGFETINEESLASSNKRFNVPAAYNEIVSCLHKNNIMVLGSFVFGFDEDDPSVFRRTWEFISKSGIDILHYAVLTPFPGTRLFQQLKAADRITTFDWSQYDGTHVVFQPARMTVKELQEGYFGINRRTHSIPSIMKRMSHNRSHMTAKFAANFGFRLYVNNFIKLHRANENHLH